MPAVRLYWKVVKPKTFGVRVLIQHPQDKNKVLLVLHTYGNRTLWNIPGGGYNPKKETADNAAKREVSEEVGIEVKSLFQVGTYQTSGEGKRDTVLLFVCAPENIDSVVKNSEIAETVWQGHPIAHKRTDVARVARRTIESAYKM